MSAGGLSTSAAARGSGAPKWLLREWVRDGVIRPSVRVSRKQGSGHRWDERDLRVLRRLEHARRQIADLILPNGLPRLDWQALAALLARAGRTQVIVVGPKGLRLISRREPIHQSLRVVGHPALVLEGNDPAQFLAAS